jgi:hypothetical protein
VAHIAEERCLGSVEFGQRFGPLALRFIGPSIGDRGGNVAGDKVEKRAIRGVQRPTRTHADDE